MSLTAEQHEVMVEAFPRGVESSGDQTPEQAENFAVMGLRDVCSLEGVDVPSEDDARAALRQLD